MNRIERVDELVERVIAGRPSAAADPELEALALVVESLRELPGTSFRERLGAELAGAARRRRTDDEIGSTPEELSVPKLTPHLTVRGAAHAIGYYERVFGARVKMRLTEPGRIGHAELAIGNSAFTLADEYPEYGILGPRSLGGTTSSISLQVEDVDAVFALAVAEGGRVIRPVRDEFYGERAGRLEDPFGHVWGISTTKERVSSSEMQKRYDAILSSPSAETPPPASPTRVPPGFHAVTPYLRVRAADRLIDFLKEAFGAVEIFSTVGSAGGRHAEVRIGDSMVMIGGLDDPSFVESPAAIYLYVPDVDAAHDRAVRAGATSTQSPADQPHGGRLAFLKDPFGNTWYIATRFREGDAATQG